MREFQSYIDPSTVPADNLELADDKSQALEVLRNFNDTLLKEVMSNEELVEKLRKEHPEADKPVSTPSLESFKLSKNTVQCCIEFLKENDVDESWVSLIDGNEKILKIFKVFFTLVSTYNQESWC